VARAFFSEPSSTRQNLRTAQVQSLELLPTGRPKRRGRALLEHARVSVSFLLQPLSRKQVKLSPRARRGAGFAPLSLLAGEGRKARATPCSWTELDLFPAQRLQKKRDRNSRVNTPRCSPARQPFYGESSSCTSPVRSWFASGLSPGAEHAMLFRVDASEDPPASSDKGAKPAPRLALGLSLTCFRLKGCRRKEVGKSSRLWT
jgi:hypothetical protein